MQPPTTLTGTTPLARFLTHTNHFNSSSHTVTSNAFMPPSSDLCLSVFTITGMTCKQVIDCGQINVIQRMTNPSFLYGFASIKVGEVQAASLTVYPDNNPQGHAAITGWPIDKSERKLLALNLASKAELVLKEECL